MATIQIKDIPSTSLTATLDFVVQENSGGPGSYGKLSAIQTLKGLNVTTVYISSFGGVDAVGYGGALTPYKSLSFALAQITDNSVTKPYLILMDGIFLEGTIQLKPYVYIDGKNSSIQVTNPVVLDAAWNTTGGILVLQNFTNLNFIGGLNLDFSAAPLSIIYMESLTTSSSSAWSITGNVAGGTIVTQNGVFGFSGAPNITIQDCYGGFNNCAPQSLSLIATSTTTTYNFDVIGNTILGDFLIKSTASANINVTSNLNSIFGNYHIQSVSGGNINVFNTACFPSSIITLDGTGMLFNTDPIPVVPTLTNGATTGNILYRVGSKTIEAVYNPLHYTPTSQQIYGHLEGIDNQLAGGYFLTNSNVIYVSPMGNDSTGIGTIQLPFATVSHAMNSATFATSTNPFDIVILGGQINDTAQINYKPWVNLKGNTEGCVLNNSLSILLDLTAWTANLGGISYIENITIVNPINFDFSSLTGPGTPTIQLDSVYSQENFICKGNSTITPQVYFKSSYLQRQIITDCVSVFSNSNTFFEFDIGTLTSAANNQLNSIGDTYSYFLGEAPNSGAVTGTYNISSSTFMIQRVIQGANVTLNIDATSKGTLATSIIAGAIENLTTGMDNVNSALYTPVNYTQTAPTVYGQIQGIDNALASLSIPKTLTIYVDSIFGIDSVSSGTVAKPYLTLAYALSQITTNSLTNPYCVKMQGNFLETSPILLKRFVTLDGQGGTTLGTSSVINLAPEWSTDGGEIIIENFDRINSDWNLDFSACPNSITVKLNNSSFSASSFVFTATENAACNFLIENCSDVNVTSGSISEFESILVKNSNINNMEFTTSDNAFSNLNYVVENSTILTLTGSTSAGLGGINSGNIISSKINQLQLVADSTGSASARIVDCDIPQIDLENTGSRITADKITSITYLSGATESQVTYINNLNTTTIYVSALIGSDSNGNGNTQNPYKTLAYALSQISGNSAGRPFLILMEGFFSETNLILKPYVIISGQGASVLEVTNQVILDSSWSATGGFCAIQSFDVVRFEGGANLDFSTFPQSVISLSDFSWDSHILFTMLGNNGLTTLFTKNLNNFNGGGSGVPPLSITDCILNFSATEFDQVDIIANTLSGGSMRNCSFPVNNLTLTSNSGATLSITASGNVYGSSVNITANSGSVVCTFVDSQHFYQNISSSTLTINGTGVAYFTDRITNMPAFSGGATFNANVQLFPQQKISQGGNLLRKKLAVFDDPFNNDFQFYGFGVLTSEFIYQIDSTAAKFTFNAATSSTSSNLVATIFGDGTALIGSGTKDPSAALQVNSTTQGFLPPVVTTTQKNAIASPAKGLVVYDSTLNKLCVQGALGWETITSV